MKTAYALIALFLSVGCHTRVVHINSLPQSEGAKPTLICSRHEGSFRVAWDPNGRDIYTWHFDREISVLDTQLREQRGIGASGDIRKFKISDSGRYLAVGEERNGTNAVVVYERSPVLKKILNITVPNDQPEIVFDPAERFLISGGYGMAAHSWELDSGRLIRAYTTDEEEGGLNIDLNPKGDMLAVGNRNGTTHIFDVASGRKLRRLQIGSYWGLGEDSGDLIHDVAFSPDGTRLATADVTGRVAVWNPRNGRLITKYHTGGSEIFCLEWSPDGKWLAFAGLTKTDNLEKAVRIINLHDKRRILFLPGQHRVFDMEFSADGQRLLVGGDTSTDIWTLDR